MDIYEFIESKDIREHCRKIQYKFTARESAFLIWQSDKTIQQKHAAYREIIETMPDEKLNERICTAEFEHLHEFLSRYMECENYLFRVFGEREEAVYMSKVFYNGEWENEKKTYSIHDVCLNETIKRWEGDGIYFAVSKKWIRREHEEPEKEVTVYFNKYEEPYKIAEVGILNEMQQEVNTLFEWMWINVPTPFKKGDIVYVPNGYRIGCPPTMYPFVLHFLCTWVDEEEMEKRKQSGDITDMTAYEYFLYKSSSQIYSECMHDYLRLERYEKQLIGKEKNLKILSLFMRDQMDIELLWNAHTIFCKEEIIQKNRDILDLYTNETLRICGLEQTTNSKNANDKGGKMTVFIGGSKTIKKLNTNVLLKLKEIIEKNHHIVVGDCPGVDTLVQQYLFDYGYENVTIYASGETVRNNVGAWNVQHIPVEDGVSGFDFYRKKDIAMSDVADYGLMIWAGKSKGTYHNIMDLQERGKFVGVLR